MSDVYSYCEMNEDRPRCIFRFVRFTMEKKYEYKSDKIILKDHIKVIYFKIFVIFNFNINYYHLIIKKYDIHL